jgi:hypothetical protein
MSLCAPTNSLQSNMMHAMVKGMPEIKPGMGITILYWTDREVGTINKVISPTQVEFTVDDTKADRSKGELQHGHQEWIHTPRPDGRPITAMRNPNDQRWYIATRTKTGKLTVSKKHQPVALGRKDYNHDWSF